MNKMVFTVQFLMALNKSDPLFFFLQERDHVVDFKANGQSDR